MYSELLFYFLSHLFSHRGGVAFIVTQSVHIEALSLKYVLCSMTMHKAYVLSLLEG